MVDLQMTKNEIFSMVIAGSAIMLMGVLIMYFLPISAFSQIMYFPKHNNSGGNTNKNDNSSVVWSNRNTTATNEPAPDNGIYKKSMSTKNVNSAHKPTPSYNKVNKFGIKEIYPTKVGGREWYVNMNNPINDSIFSIGPDQSIAKEGDGSWRITNPEVRMAVTTPQNSKPWKNVEITGYVKVISIKNRDKGIPEDIAWFARGGIHNADARCNGTALIGGIRVDGSVGWKKEIWFTGGYTDELAKAKVTNSSVDRWIGWKVVMYNVNNNTAVKMESYLDNNNTNHWIRVTNLTDNGGWYADTSDKKFDSANCGKPKDYIMTNSGPAVTFRSDNMILDFKNLSVREIQALPVSFSHSSL
jgi:hypothetical protein